jgi:FkbM family methyltransferase
MKSKIIFFLKIIINSFLAVVFKFRISNYIFKNIINFVMESYTEVVYRNLNLRITTPNSLCKWRALTFSSKEPETLEWIDSMPKKSIFWDIGANIGLYSIYAAKSKNCKVWAFEPSVFNLELLARNIFINDLTKQIVIVPLALNDSLRSSQLKLTTKEWGGALSNFGRNFGWDGKMIKEVFEFQTIGISLDEVKKLLKIPQPDFIKIDVDGLEHFILKGGHDVLSATKEVLIEINDDFKDQAKKSNDILTDLGLVLKEKRQAEYIASNTDGWQYTYNQIWVRK